MIFNRLNELIMKTVLSIYLMLASLAFGQASMVNGKGDGVSDAGAFRDAIGARADDPIFWGCGPARTAVRSAMESGAVSTSIQIIGDSMTNDSVNEWAGLLANLVATKYPDFRVVVGDYNLSANDYDFTVIQAGVDGERYVNFPTVADGGTLNRSLSVPLSRCVDPVTDDIEMIVDIELEDWSSIPSTFNLAGIYGGNATNSRFRLYLTTGRTLVANGFDDADVNRNIPQSSALPSLTAGQRVMLRVRYDDDTGAGSYSCLYSYSTNGGSTWTDLGSAKTGTSLGFGNGASFDAGNSKFEIGARGTTADDVLGGKIYRVEYRDGIGGPLMNPQALDSYSFFDVTDTQFLEGTPTLTILNASKFGYDHADWVSEGLGFVIQDWGPGVSIVCLGYNEALVTGDAYVAQVETITPTLLSRRPYSSLVQCIEPFSSEDTNRFAFNMQRTQLLSALCGQNNWGLIDFNHAFDVDGRGDAVLFDVDRIHPNAVGEAVMAATVARALGLN